jgi:predicted phosphodiesterase
MRLHVMSDLHIDFHDSIDPFVDALDLFRSKYEEPDALVLAGDLCELGGKSSSRGRFAMDALCSRYRQVIYVPGNHEAWGTSIRGAEEEILSWDFDNLHLLKPGKAFILDGQRFFGGTGWYPDCEAPALKGNFPDYRAIKNFEAEVYAHHAAFRLRLEKDVGPEDIVVSHHLPSSRSTPPQFKYYSNNCFFVMDGIEELVKAKQPKLYIHGHTHSPFDYRIGSTRVYANPYGYPYESANPKFWERVAVAL